MFLIIACVVIALWYLIEYLKWRKNILIPMGKLPGPKRYPIFGTTYILIGIPRNEIFNFYINYIKKMPSLYCTWNGNVPELNLREPEHLELIMNNSIHTTKGKLYDYLLPWLGDGLLTSTGAKWQKHRKLITPTFHFKILENFMNVFKEKSQILLDQLQEKTDEDFFDIYPYITHCTLDIICETAMGVPVNAMTNKDSSYVKSIYRICDLITWRFIKPYIAWDALFYHLPAGKEFKKHKTFLHEFSYKVIADRKALLEKERNAVKDNEETSKRNTKLSFLDLLLEASNNDIILNDKNIREEVDTFMFEGHDTTTAGICWCLFLLGHHPEIQHKIFLELRDVLGEKTVPTTIEELNQLKYLECVIKETLRLYPSVPLILRTLAEDIYIDKYKVPAGVQVVLHIYQVHRNPNHFAEPEKFDPDRFLPENSIGRHPYAYIPFSAGPRNCIGQKFAMYEEKTILATILKKFEIRSAEFPEDMKLCAELILRPDNGIKIKLIKRNK